MSAEEERPEAKGISLQEEVQQAWLDFASWMRESAHAEDRACGEGLEARFGKSVSASLTASPPPPPPIETGLEEAKEALRTRGFCVFEGVVSDHACEASRRCVSRMISIATCSRDFDVDDPRCVDRLVHDGCFSGRIAWSPAGEIFGAGSGWWAPRIALALFHPRIRATLLALEGPKTGGDGRRIVSLPAPIILGDVPELRKMGLSTSARRYADVSESAVDACAEAERAWAFARGGRVQVFRNPARDDESSEPADLVSPQSKRMRRAAFEEEEKKAAAAAPGADPSRAPVVAEVADVPTGALLVLARGYSIRFVNPPIARIPLGLGTIRRKDADALEERLRSEGYSREVAKKHLGRASEVRRAFKAAFGSDPLPPEVAALVAPPVAIPVGSTAATAAIERFESKCDSEGLALTCKFESSFRGMRDIYPRAREFDSSTRAGHIEKLDALVANLAAVAGAGKRS